MPCTWDLYLTRTVKNRGEKEGVWEDIVFVCVLGIVFMSEDVVEEDEDEETCDSGEVGEDTNVLSWMLLREPWVSEVGFEESEATVFKSSGVKWKST